MPRRIEQKVCLSRYFLNFLLRFGTLFILSLADLNKTLENCLFYQYIYIYMLCLVNWTYVPRGKRIKPRFEPNVMLDQFQRFMLWNMSLIAHPKNI